MSDVAATTTPEAGAVTTEDAFQAFFDAGGLNDPQKREEGQQTQANAGEGGATSTEQQTQMQAADDGQQTQAQQDDTPQYSSLSELLTAHKIDPESVMGLHVTAKIDGKETQVPLSDVLKSYQLEGHVNNKSIELSNLRSQFDQEQQAWRAAQQQVMQQHQQMASVAMQMLNHDFSKVDWNTLRIQNPAEFAALQAEFHQRQGQIQNFLGQVQQQAALEAEQQQQSMRALVAQEQQKLFDAVPEWRSAETFSKDREAMTKYARSLGFQDAELGQIFDHRYMRVLHDAARYQALQAASPEALKKVRQAPPMAAPGSRTDVNPKEAQKRNALERLNRNPNDIDAQAAAFDFFAN